MREQKLRLFDEYIFFFLPLFFFRSFNPFTFLRQDQFTELPYFYSINRLIFYIMEMYNNEVCKFAIHFQLQFIRIRNSNLIKCIRNAIFGNLRMIFFFFLWATFLCFKWPNYLIRVPKKNFGSHFRKKEPQLEQPISEIQAKTDRTRFYTTSGSPRLT